MNEETKPADILALFKFDMEKTVEIHKLKSTVRSLLFGLAIAFVSIAITTLSTVKLIDGLSTRVLILEKTVGNISNHPADKELAAERARIDNLMDSIAALNLELQRVASSNNWGIYYQRQLATFDYNELQKQIGYLRPSVDYLNQTVRLILNHNQKETNEVNQAEEAR